MWTSGRAGQLGTLLWMWQESQALHMANAFFDDGDALFFDQGDS